MLWCSWVDIVASNVETPFPVFEAFINTLTRVGLARLSITILSIANSAEKSKLLSA